MTDEELAHYRQLWKDRVRRDPAMAEVAGRALARYAVPTSGGGGFREQAALAAQGLTEPPTYPTVDEEAADGPGTELASLLESVGIQTGGCGGCKALKDEMDKWGLAGCRAHRVHIVPRLRERVRTAGWAVKLKAAVTMAATDPSTAWRMDPRDLAGSLFDEAVRRAEAKQQQRLTESGKSRGETDVYPSVGADPAGRSADPGVPPRPEEDREDRVADVDGGGGLGGGPGGGPVAPRDGGPVHGPGAGPAGDLRERPGGPGPAGGAVDADGGPGERGLRDGAGPAAERQAVPPRPDGLPPRPGGTLGAGGGVGGGAGPVAVGRPRAVPFRRYERASSPAATAAVIPHFDEYPTVVRNPRKAAAPLRWSYGVTTCPARVKDGLLCRTLTSLAAAGFDAPTVFIDGELPPEGATDPRLRLARVVERGERVKPYAHWVLAFTELYYRDPCAGRFAVFQDDLVAVRGLRAYLDAAPWPGRGYLNLYAAPSNELVAPPGHVGWYEAKTMTRHPHQVPQGLQTGQGALALVFDREAAAAVLNSPHMTNRLVTEPGPGNRLTDRVPSPTGWRSIDGGVVTAMNYAGFREYVHAPGLVQHTGVRSTVDKDSNSTGDRDRFPAYEWTPDRTSRSFPGEQFDAVTLLGTAQS